MHQVFCEHPYEKVVRLDLSYVEQQCLDQTDELDLEGNYTRTAQDSSRHV